MQVQLRIASAGKETGALLKELLTNANVYSAKGEGIVSYGLHLCDKKDPKILNGVAARGKIFNMEAMVDAGVCTVPWFRGSTIPEGLKFPLFARKNSGCGGEDLMPVFHPQEVPWRVKAGWSWFSTIIPVRREFRVWVFRNQILDIYEKVMQRPSEFAFMGRNFRNGFEFRPLEIREDRLLVPYAITLGAEAIKAVACLDLDFAAVDMITDDNDHVFVLEVNTAPGVIRSGAQSTLKKLAARIEAWAKEF